MTVRGTALLAAAVPIGVGWVLGLVVGAALQIATGPAILLDGRFVGVGTLAPSLAPLLFALAVGGLGTVIGARAAAAVGVVSAERKDSERAPISVADAWRAALSFRPLPGVYREQGVRDRRGLVIVAVVLAAAAVGVLHVARGLTFEVPVLDVGVFVLIAVTTSLVLAIVVAVATVRRIVMVPAGVGPTPGRGRFLPFAVLAVLVPAVLAASAVVWNPVGVPVATSAAGPRLLGTAGATAVVGDDAVSLYSVVGYDALLVGCTRVDCGGAARVWPFYAPSIAGLADGRVVLAQWGVGNGPTERGAELTVSTTTPESLRAFTEEVPVSGQGPGLLELSDPVVLDSVPGADLAVLDGSSLDRSHAGDARTAVAEHEGRLVVASAWNQRGRQGDTPDISSIAVYSCTDTTCADMSVDRTETRWSMSFHDVPLTVAVAPDGTTFTTVLGTGPAEDADLLSLFVGTGSGTLEQRVLVPGGPDVERHGWRDTTAGAEVAVDTQGRAVVAFRSPGEQGITLLRCVDRTCTGWDTTVLAPTAQGDFALALDSTDRPLLLATRPASTDPETTDVVLLSCLDRECEETSQTVLAHDLALERIDLGLDPSDRPVVTLRDSVLWCTEARCGAS